MTDDSVAQVSDAPPADPATAEDWLRTLVDDIRCIQEALDRGLTTPGQFDKAFLFLAQIRFHHTALHNALVRLADSQQRIWDAQRQAAHRA